MDGRRKAKVSRPVVVSRTVLKSMTGDTIISALTATPSLRNSWRAILAMRKPP